MTSPGDMLKKKIRTFSAGRINKLTLDHVDLSFPSDNQDCIIFFLHIALVIPLIFPNAPSE